jgi:membrane associated rhomboid family serine protease
MGIQDRDYYRNEGPSVLDALLPSGIVCRWLIALNVGVFFLQLVALNTVPPAAEGVRSLSYGWVTDWLILDPEKVLQGQVWRLLTYAFLHEPVLVSFHLLFNMLFLWWFGSDVEQLYGRKEFLAIYLTSALLGGLAFFAWGITQESPTRCLGASGAVTTMLVLCALHFPRRIVFMWFLPMPIWLFAIINVMQDAVVFVGGLKTGTAVVVHLAGAVFAVAYYKWQRSIVEVLHDLAWWKKSPARNRLKLFRPEPERDDEPVAVSATAPAKPQTVAMDEHLEAKLDAVLEKIAKTGKDSLTQEEQAILQQASEMYKRRRN